MGAGARASQSFTSARIDDCTEVCAWGERLLRQERRRRCDSHGDFLERPLFCCTSHRGVSRMMKRTAWDLAAVLVVVPAGAWARGVTPSLPLNLEPEIEAQI